MVSTRRTPTHYDVLDVEPHAGAETVHAAWRQMASLVHPDAALVDSDPEEYADRELMMKTVNAAWEVLGDPLSRAQYDTDIGLDRSATRILLRLRRGARAAGRARDAEPLKLHRPSLLSRPPLLAEAQVLAHFVWSTRLGQWLLLLILVGLAELASVDLAAGTRGPLVLGVALLVGAALARGGEPTPAADAGHAAAAAAHLGYRALVRLLRLAGHELLSLLASRSTSPPTPPA